MKEKQVECLKEYYQVSRPENLDEQKEPAIWLHNKLHHTVCAINNNYKMWNKYEYMWLQHWLNFEMHTLCPWGIHS